MKIQTVSSRWTFLFKLALPLFWLIVMGGICMVIIFSPLDGIREPFNPFIAKVLISTFYLSVLLFMYLFFGKSKWVGITTSHLYVSNFFHSYKYTLDSISGIEEKNYFLFKLVKLDFHESTKFGNSVFFIKSHYWDYFLKKQPEVYKLLHNKEEPVISEIK
jgi:hypothetical protein